MKAIIAAILLFFTVAIFGQGLQSISFSPDIPVFSADAGRPLYFKVETSPDDSLLHYQWMKDGKAAGSSNDLYCSYEYPGEHRLECVVSDGESSSEKRWLVSVRPCGDFGVKPGRISLRYGDPNPFSQENIIELQLDSPQHVEINVLDQQQQHVRQLFVGYLTPATYHLFWHGTDDRGTLKENGIYHLTAKSDQDTTGVTEKFLYMR